MSRGLSWLVGPLGVVPQVLISERCRRDPPRALQRVAQFLGMQVGTRHW